MAHAGVKDKPHLFSDILDTFNGLRKLINCSLIRLGDRALSDATFSNLHSIWRHTSLENEWCYVQVIHRYALL